MKNLGLVFCILLGIAFSAIMVNAGAGASASATSIQKCGVLLPEGYKFSLEFTGIIDTTTQARNFEVQFTLSDDTDSETPNASSKEVTAFLNCASPLIKPNVAAL